MIKNNYPDMRQTDIFQREMKRNLQSVAHKAAGRLSLRAALLLLLMAVGSVVNEAWAVDYKFKIINNKGKQCLNYTINTTTLTVHQKERSMFATNFRFYTSEDDAIADAYGETGLTYYTEGTAISGISGITDNTFYVRYDMVSSPEIDLSGKKWYYIQTCSRYAIKYYIYYDSSNDEVIMATDGTASTKPTALTPDKSDKWLWKFVSNGDPYDVYLVNRLGEKLKPSYVLTAANVGSTNDNVDKQIYGSYASKIADASYNQSAAKMDLQSFVITQGKNFNDGQNGKFHIIGAYNGFEIKPKDYSSYTARPGNEESLPYYLCANGCPNSPPGYGRLEYPYNKLNIFRTDRAEDSRAPGTEGNLSQLTITEVETAKVTYHMLNKQNRVAISLTVDQMPSWIDGIRTSELEIPEEIKSPLATNFKYYEASAVSANGDGTYTVTGSSITELTDQTAPADIYVTYDIDDTNPSVAFGDSQNYYMQVNGQWIKAASPSAMSGTTTFSEAEGQSDYLWKIGLDPYDIQLTNASLSEKVFGSTGTTDATTLQFADSSPTYSSFVLLSGKGTSLALALATGSALANESLPLAYVACSGSGSALTLQRAVNADADDVQVNLHHSNLRDYTYKVYTKTSNGTEVAAVETVAAIAGQVPSLPESIRAAFSSDYQYYEADGTTPMSVYPNASTTIVVKNYTVSEPTIELSGERYYYINVGGKYLYNNSGTLAYATTSANNDNYLWAPTTSANDPYHVVLKNKANASVLTQPFVLMPGSTDGQYELLQASSTDAKLFLKTGETSPATSRHGAATVQTVFSSPQVSVTMQILIQSDESKTITLPVQTFDGGGPLSVPVPFKSPLLSDGDYTYYSSSAAADKATSQITRAPYTDGTIYVRYSYEGARATSPVNIDGGSYYMMKFTSGNRWMFNAGTDAQVQATTDITSNNRPRQDRFQWYFTGGDPYYIQIVSRANPELVLGKRNQLADAGTSDPTNTNNAYLDTNGNATYIQHFFLTKDPSLDTWQLMAAHEAINGLFLYYGHENNNLFYIDGKSERQSGNAYLQFELSPYQAYHVVNNKGAEAIQLLVPADDDLSLPEEITSPLTNSYTYYPTQADAVAGTNVLSTAKGTKDIWVRYTYDNATSPLDLSGQTWYNWKMNNTGGTDKWLRKDDNNTQRVYYTTPNPVEATLKTYNYQWALSGNDPYDIKLINRRWPDHLLSLQVTEVNGTGDKLLKTQWTESELTESGYLHSFILTQASGLSTYQMMAAARNTAADNQSLFCYLRNNNGDYPYIQVSADLNQQHGYNVLQMSFTSYRTYSVVNLSGEVALTSTVTTGGALSVPAHIKSPLVSNWTYYATLADAQNKVNALDAAPPTGNIYCRYDYDNATSAVDLTGKTLYIWTFTNCNGRLWGRPDVSTAHTLYRIAYDNQVQSKTYQWYFTGGDPYKVTAVCRGIDDRVLSTQEIPNNNDQKSVYLRGNSDTKVVDTWAILQNAEHTSTYEFAATGSNMVNNNNEELAYLYSGATNNDNFYLRRDNTNKTGSDNVQCTLSPYRTYLVIDGQGEEAIRYTVPTADNGGTDLLQLPHLIKSAQVPYGQFSYYETEADALAKENAISGTSAKQHGDKGYIYVRYTYDAATDPTRLDISGTTWYNWIFDTSRFMYSNGVFDNTNHHRVWTTAQNVTTPTADNYKFSFNGSDPYRLVVKNKDIGDDYVVARMTKQRSGSYGGDVNMVMPDDSHLQYFIITQDESKETAGTYQVMGAYKTTEIADNWALFYYFSRDNTTSQQLTISGRTMDQAGQDICQVRFVAPTTYRIINKQGQLMWGDIPGLTSSDGQVTLPDAYKSPLATNYRYYSDGGYNAETGKYTPTGLIDPSAYVPANGGIVYVLYDYDPDNLVTFGSETVHVDLTGQTTYLLNTGNNKTKNFWHWDSANLTKTKSNTSNLDGNHTYYQVQKQSGNYLPTNLSPNHLWTLTSADGQTPDPYDIVIHSAAFPDYFLSVQDGLVTTGNGSHPWAIHNDETGQNIVRSWALVNGSTSNPYKLFATTLVNGNEVDVPTDGDGWVKRTSYLSAGEGNSNGADVQFLPRQLLSFHIVNTYNELALSVGKDYPADPSASIALPSELTTPVIDASLSDSYKFFKTRQEAYAYSRANSDAARTAAATKAITTYNDLASQRDIYVGYYYNPKTAPAGSPKLNSDGYYHIYWNEKNGEPHYAMRRISEKSGEENNTWASSSLTPSGNTVKEKYFQWIFSGNDPYHLNIINRHVYNATSARTIGFQAKSGANQYADGSFGTLNTVFILRPGTTEGTYNIASTTINTSNPTLGTRFYLYYIDCTLSNGSLRIYANDNTEFVNNVYQSDRAGCQLTITPVTSDTYTYHIIDLSGQEVITYDLANSAGDTPDVPLEIKSPLATNWRYYDDIDKATADATATAANPTANYKPTGNITTLGSGKDIYARYSVANTVNLAGPEFTAESIANDYDSGSNRKEGTGHSYLIEFQNGLLDYQESNDNVFFESKGEISVGKLLYPESNGNEQFYIYNEDTKNTAFRNGTNLRKRLLWYFTGGDPYRVRILSYNSNTNYNYFSSTYGQFADGTWGLQTSLVPYRERDNEDTNFANHQGTEYMILASGANYKIVTTEAVKNGTDEDVLTSIADRTVNTMEHNFKYNPTYNTNLDDDEKTAMGIYQHDGYIKRYARTSDWTGSNDRPYYATVYIGEAFKLIQQDLVPSLTLIDNHGWEVKTWSTPQSSSDEHYNDIVQSTLKYNSPMVDKYYWYVAEAKTDGTSDVTKATHYYKYTFKEGLEPYYVSESLTDYPHIQGGKAMPSTNYFVTYSVKPQFTDESLLYLINQNNNVAVPDASHNITNTTAASTIYTGATVTNGIASGGTYFDDKPEAEQLWHVEHNADIDVEMGYIYSGENGEGTREEIEAAYDANGKNGFDPYCLRLSSYTSNRYLSATYDSIGNVRTGDGTLVLEETPTVKTTREDISHNTLQITGATFMAVLDQFGNMRLMPRFETDEINSLGVKTRAAYCVHDLNTIAVATNDAGAEVIAAQKTTLVPAFKHIFHVVDKNGYIAINADLTYMESVGGDHPVLPKVIRSPFITNTHFYTNASMTEEVDKLPAKGEFWVTYDYDPATFSTLDVSGTKYYQFILPVNNKYVHDENRTPTQTDTEDKTEDYLWKIDGHRTVGGADVVDPYHLTLTSMSGTSVTDDPYIVVEGATTGQWELLKANGATNHYTYLKQDNGTGLTTEQTETGVNDIQVQFKGIPLQVTYYVINLRNKIATHNVARCEGGDLVANLPSAIKSPLVKEENFRFWKANNDSNTPEAIESNEYSKTADRFDYSGAAVDVYVTYTYDNDESPLDLNARSGYNIFSEDYYALKCDNGSNPQPQFMRGVSDADLRTNYYIWQLEPVAGTPDPYDVVVSRRKLMNGTTDYHDHSFLHTSKNSGTDERRNANWVWDMANSWRFIIINGDHEGSYKLMAASFTDGKYNQYVQDITTDGITTSHYWYLDKYTDNYPDVTRDNETNVANSKFNFTLKPVDLVDVLFHVLHKMTGVEQTYLQKDYTARDPIVLPDVILRKYCDYTYYTKWRNNATMKAGEVDTSTRVETCIEANKTTTVPYVINESGQNATINIFVDYAVSGMPFNLLANTKEGVEKLEANEGNVLNTIFDMTADGNLSLYDKMTAEVTDLNGHTHQRKDLVYFMVLGTNNDFSQGNQNFLRRESTGRLSTLASYKLHYDNTKNNKNWSYSRCAEAYRPNDHATFEEKNWLFAFAGDPYDLYIYNASAVDENAYDVVEMQAEHVGFHPQHTVNLTTLTNEAGTTTEYVPSTPDLTAAAPALYGWGLCESRGTGADQTFSLAATEPLPDAETGSQLLWQLSQSSIDKANEVVLKSRAANYTGLDYNLQVLPYQPVKYEDVQIVIRRKDEVKTFQTWASEHPSATDAEVQTQLDKMTTGISKLYFAASERVFSAGDTIPHNDPKLLPIEVRRAFCDYTLYESKSPFDVEDKDYIVKPGPYPDYTKPLRNTADTDSLYDEDGHILYKYYNVDDNGNAITATPGGTDTIFVDHAQSIYAHYVVKSDIFLAEHPDSVEVARMANENDHVFFMDFPDPSGTGTSAWHHAYYDPMSTYREQTGDLKQKIDRTTGNYRTEKKKRKGKEFVDDQENIYNHYQYRTAGNRMESVPENLKWYFVGDPYKVQVYCTAGEWGSNNAARSTWAAANGKNEATVQANLARFDLTETNFQFVVDCVHLRVPDYSIIDTRPTLIPTDEDGRALPDEEHHNRHQGEPFYNDFYWECVPSATNVEGGFALRFKEDNDLMGYRNVYYYLAHNSSLKKQYKDGQYSIDLSYNANNAKYDSGDYKDYHTANNAQTVIKLVQPAKVYVTVTRTGDSRYADKSNVVVDELSEYFGLGETLTEVPRHLQRKFVTYDWTSKTLTENTANPDSIGTCTTTTTTHSTINDLMPDSLRVAKLKTNPVFKYTVNYTVNDLSQENGEHHYFSPDESKLEWVDMTIGNNNWLYYDKTNTPASLVSNYRRAMSQNRTGWNNEVDGWNDGLKGLHWALVGDPYDFVILNRRQKDDGTDGKYLTLTKTTIADYAATVPNDSVIWTTSLTAAPTDDNTSTAIAAASTATHFSTQMWKVGNDDTNYFLRTASLKTGTGDNNNASGANQTNNYWRMVASTYGTNPDYTSYFEMVPYSLSDKDSYTNTVYMSNFSQTMNGLGVTQQKMEIRTAVAKDDDKANNDCFDADVYVYSAAGEQRIHTENMEIRYGDAIKSMPISLKRYGCKYTCYINYDPVTRSGTQITDFDSDEFRALVASGGVKLYYVYTLTNEAEQYFTTADEAQTDDYTWMNTYFQWQQTYSGTNVEVEKIRRVFDHYVYNSAGEIIDEVWREDSYTETVANPNTAYETKGYLNTHTGQTPVYGDEIAQSEDDRQKWSLVGDPYTFTMKNYAQYLKNANATATVDANGVVQTSNIESRSFTICLDKDGTTYLAIIDADGNILECIDFEYSNTSDKSLYTADATGLNQNDPTGNTLKVTYTGASGKQQTVKPFHLANLIRYADVLVYHLVMAHQHSLDAEDATSWTSEQKTGNDQKNGSPTGVYSRLLEFLKYWGKKNGTTYVSDEGTTVENVASRANTTAVKTLLKEKGTLRNFLHYPIADQEVTRIGIGNRPQLPWYMKRQFCQYTMYQRDVMRSVIDTTSTYTDSQGNTAYNIKWVSIFDISYWNDWQEGVDSVDVKYEVTQTDAEKWGKGLVAGKIKKIPSGYNEALSLQGTTGKVLDKLYPCHENRKVIIDVVYEVNPEKFRFATRGRNTTAWYSMMTNNEVDGLMNFSYKDGIGARQDKTHHYTNNYLWAPEGDPYGFVLRSRYATINGTGWDDVAVTTKGKLPKGMDSNGNEIYKSSDAAGPVAFSEPSDADKQATYTSRATSSGGIPFNNRRIIHLRTGQEGATTDGATNAVYEMFVGGFSDSFLMHPTAAWMKNDNPDYETYFMRHNINENTNKHTTTLTKAKAESLLNDKDANWRLQVNTEQLLPYFDRAGFVGGIDPQKALNYTYRNYYSQLQSSKESGTPLSFSTLAKIQDVVYDGTFYRNNTQTELAYTESRPTTTGEGGLPLRFESANLINMKPGYYRIRAFSEDALNTDGRDLKADGSATTDDVGIVGPRYISGYRFESEKTDTCDSNNDGGRWLHFFETDMKSSTIHTFADLKKAIDAAGKAADDRDWFDHVAMRGNIEILPADFDPSSIFQFTKVQKDTYNYDRYTISTQGMDVHARPGGTEGEAVTFGKTELKEAGSTPAKNFDNKFRIEDIGGAAMTIRVRKVAGSDWDDMVSENLKTNYVCIDRYHRYRITCHTDNEMAEIGDHYTTDGYNGIQDTKWLLQPVGIREDWPYNQMPLRVEVQKGGKQARDNTQDDPYYYGTLYVPFDTRLGNTTDAAFTLTSTPTNGTLTMPSVSQHNGMGNPQYVPAQWPVVLRTNAASSVTLKNQNGFDYATKHYVNMYLPNDARQSVALPQGCQLQGEYLEQEIAVPKGQSVLVFGVPFKEEHVAHQHAYDREAESVGWYTNENWMRGHGEGSIIGETGEQPTENDGSAKAAFLATPSTTTEAQRSNAYVYHNKAYLLYTSGGSGAKERFTVIFEGDEWEEELPEDEDIEDTVKKKTPWPCDVYDLSGRKVATHETPQTLRQNNPGLPKGVYIFGHTKVVVK